MVLVVTPALHDAGREHARVRAADGQLGRTRHVLHHARASRHARRRLTKLRALVVPTPRRLPSLPDVPTSSEAGLPGLQSYVWFGVSTPHGTPAAVVTRLNTEMVRLLADKEIQATFTKSGIEASGGTPEEFVRFVGAELEKWSKIVKSGGVKIEN